MSSRCFATSETDIARSRDVLRMREVIKVTWSVITDAILAVRDK